MLAPAANLTYGSSWTHLETAVTNCDFEDVEDSSELDPRVPGVWVRDAAVGSAEPGADRASLEAYRGPTGQEAVAGRVKDSPDGTTTLLTSDSDLDEGGVVYVHVRGERRPHRILSLRRGLRARDQAGLRVGRIVELVS